MFRNKQRIVFDLDRKHIRPLCCLKEAKKKNLKSSSDRRQTQFLLCEFKLIIPLFVCHSCQQFNLKST